MQIVEPISEAEVVAAFLKQEIVSTRWRQPILDILVRDGRERRIVDEPDTSDEAENTYRAALLGEFRGYRRNASLFTGFPDEVHWYRAAIGKEELAQVRYIDYSYWVELSGGSRLPTDAVERIRQGVEVYGVSNAGFWKVANAAREGVPFPEPILIGEREGSPLVVLEGHVRLTAYFLWPESIPPALPVIVGFSEGIARWSLY